LFFYIVFVFFTSFLVTFFWLEPKESNQRKTQVPRIALAQACRANTRNGLTEPLRGWRPYGPMEAI
jgi:hypothetical protein